MPERLLELRDGRRRGQIRGLPSVGTAHPLALRTAMEEVRAAGMPLLVESSCGRLSHVESNPAAFRDGIHALAEATGLGPAGVILGVRRLGPRPWCHEPAETAMEKAGALVEACVAAGFGKLHLEAGTPCEGDGPAVAPAEAAKRAAALCARAERAWQAAPSGVRPVYVVGSERGPGARARMTPVPELHRSLDLLQAAFAAEGAAPAWDRVVALAIQPGVDFGETSVHPYAIGKGQPLAKAIASRMPWMFQVRGTDYQSPEALRALVEDGAGILEVGPWLTFVCREALFALEDVARELGAPIRLREVLDGAMRRDPTPWRARQPGAEPGARLFSLRDRSRHCWRDPEVEAEVARLLEATAGPLPLQILGLHRPLALDAVLDGELEPRGPAIVAHAVRRVLKHYADACIPQSNKH